MAKVLKTIVFAASYFQVASANRNSSILPSSGIEECFLASSSTKGAPAAAKKYEEKKLSLKPNVSFPVGVEGGQDTVETKPKAEKCQALEGSKNPKTREGLAETPDSPRQIESQNLDEPNIKFLSYKQRAINYVNRNNLMTLVGVAFLRIILLVAIASMILFTYILAADGDYTFFAVYCAIWMSWVIFLPMSRIQNPFGPAFGGPRETYKSENYALKTRCWDACCVISGVVAIGGAIIMFVAHFYWNTPRVHEFLWGHAA